MDLSFSETETAFRNAVRDFLRASLPPETRRKMVEGLELAKDEIVAWQRILNAKGWATPSWPKEWGGPGWNAVERYIFYDELHQAPAPEPLSFNVSMIGPVLIQFGTDAQKRRFLTRAANLDDWWCQGFSEPGAGSDLAALKCSARRDSDHYTVTGQKLWQGMAHHADWMFTLVRTDPGAAKKQAGISLLLIDMRSPGITVRPIMTIDGRHEVNEVFLDDVQVPAENLVGTENRGWDCAKFLLGNERTGIARIGMTKQLIRRAKSLAAAIEGDDGPLAEDRRFREAAAAIEVELMALEITQMRVLSAQRQAETPDPRSSILKLKGTEIRQAASELLMQVAGPLAARARDGEPAEPSSAVPGSTAAAPAYFNLRAASIYGGSNEVQKNIIAKAILGL